MRTCRSCFRSDLDDVVEHCPYCGASTSGAGHRFRVVRRVVEIFGWVVLAVFLLAIVGCVAFMAMK